jgi:hypothetical protein
LTPYAYRACGLLSALPRGFDPWRLGHGQRREEILDEALDGLNCHSHIECAGLNSGLSLDFSLGRCFTVSIQIPLLIRCFPLLFSLLSGGYFAVQEPIR